MDTVLSRARADARALADGGMDAVLVENFGDSPFFPGPVPPETVAAMARSVAAVREVVSVPVGVNVLRTDARAALAVAAATGATFIRINVHTGGMYTDQGWIPGRAAATVRQRERWAPGVAILADVQVKHAIPPSGTVLEESARDAWHRGHADGLIVSGVATGSTTDLDQVRRVRRAVPDAVVLVGSGVTAETVRQTLDTAHGAIVGSALERGGEAGGEVDLARVQALASAAGRTPRAADR
jgi:membrane complex biogenesis BtpA family protein